MTRASLRPQAEFDLVDQAAYYRAQAGPELARRFFDHAIRAVRAIERSPGAGSPHAGEVTEIPRLRSWPVRGFPVRWYYFWSEAAGIDVVRLLADGRDIAALLIPGAGDQAR